MTRHLLARNTLLNFFGQGVPGLLLITTLPLVVRGLGEERFGLLALCWVVLGYTAVLDLGLGRAVVRFTADAIGRQAVTRIWTITTTAAAVQVSMGCLAGVVLALATPVIVGSVFHIPPGLAGEARMTLRVFAAFIPVVLASNAFQGALEGAQRFDLVNAVRTPVLAAHALVPLVAVRVGLGLPQLAALVLSADLIGLLALAALCRRVLPHAGRPRFSRDELRRMLAFGKWVAVSLALDPILSHSERLVIGSFMTMAAVTAYTAPFELATRLWIIPISLGAALYPALGTLSGQGRHDRISVLGARSTAFVLGSLGPVVALVVAAAPLILNLWLGPGFAWSSTAVLRILALGVLANSLARVPFALLHGIGRSDVTAKFHLVEVPVHLGLLVVLVWAFGVPGAAMAWTLRVTLDTCLLFMATHRLGILPVRALGNGRVYRVGLVVLVLILAAGVLAVRQGSGMGHAR